MEGVLFLIWLLLGVGGAAATLWMIRRVWRQRRDSSIATRIFAIFMTAAALSAGAGTSLGIVQVIGAAHGESVDPAQRARMLAEGISEAINCTALALVVWVPAILATFWLSKKSKDKES